MTETIEASEVKVNGMKLGNQHPDVTVTLRADLQAQTQHRSDSHRPTAAEENRKWTGKNLPRFRARLIIEGPQAEVAKEVAFIAEQMDVDDAAAHVTLEASGPFWRDVERAAIWPDGFVEKPLSNEVDTYYRFNLNLLIRGQWVSDGGEYEHKQVRWFKKTANGWERDDGVTFTDDQGPRIRVPDPYWDSLDDDLAEGYPVFIKRSDLQKTGSTREEAVGQFKDQEALDRGVERWELEYKVEDYMHPLPSEGEIGRVPLWIAPSKEWLNGELSAFFFGEELYDTLETVDGRDAQPIHEPRETEADDSRVTESGSVREHEETVPFLIDE